MREILEVIKDRYPKGPTVELTELGRGLASQLEFPAELEEFLPIFFRDILPGIESAEEFSKELAHKDFLIEF
jgi:hypothetical protein